MKVVLDTGSTDRTPEIARKFVPRFMTEWCNDFTAARNQSLNTLEVTDSGSDADEVLVPEIAPTLKQAIKRDSHL